VLRALAAKMALHLLVFASLLAARGAFEVEQLA